jgi:hypothetical protein
MKLTIPTTQKKFYRQVLAILSSLPPLSKLRNRELSLLALIMYYNHIYKNIDEPLRWRIIDDTATRREMQKELNMSEYLFSTNLGALKRVGVITHDGELAKFLQIIPKENKFEVTFIFSFDDE